MRVAFHVEYNVGVGLLDFMTKTQTDPETGQDLPPFGVAGGNLEDAVEPYKTIKGENVVNDAIYIVKANVPTNTEAFSYVQTQLSNSKIKFLVDEQQAKANFLSTARGQKATVSERNEYLIPYEMTSILKTQMMNLVTKNEGVNILLERSNKKIKKDKFSASKIGASPLNLYI